MIRFARASGFIWVLGGLAAGCGSVAGAPDAEVSQQEATLTVTRGGAGLGTVTSTPAGIDCGSTCTMTVPVGTVVTLTGTALAGSGFMTWSGAGCSGTGTCEVTVTENTAVSAMFSVNGTLLVDLPGAGMGTVTSDPVGIDCGDDCIEEYPAGTVVTLTAAVVGSTFEGWSEACDGTDATCEITVDSAVHVSATFAPDRQTLTVARTGTGSVVITSSPPGINCPGDCTEDFDFGIDVTLTADPDTSMLTGWSGGGCGGVGNCVVTMNQSQSVTASMGAPAGCRFTAISKRFICISNAKVDTYAAPGQCAACTEKGLVNACVDDASCASGYTNSIVEALYLERSGTTCTSQPLQTGFCGWGEIMTPNFQTAGQCPTPQDCTGTNWSACNPSTGTGAYDAYIYGVCDIPP